MTERDEGWDGGWEEAVDGGEGLGELMLGPVHPYDRNDGYAPAPRWATRTILGLGEDDREPSDRRDDHRDFFPGAKARKQRGAGTSPALRTSGRPVMPKEERDRRAADALGLSVDALRKLRRDHQTAANRTGTVGLPKAEREARVAAELGMTVEQLRRFRRVEASRDGSRVKTTQDTPQKRTKTKSKQPATTVRSKAPVPATWDEFVVAYQDLERKGLLHGSPEQRLKQACSTIGIGRKRALKLRSKAVRPGSEEPSRPPSRRPALPREGFSSSAVDRRQRARRAVAKKLGLSEQAVSAALAVRVTGGPGRKAGERRRTAAARGLGLDPAEVELVQRTYMRVLEATSPASSGQPQVVSTGHGSRLRHVSDEQAPDNVCLSCGHPVSVNGFCGCS